MIMPDANLFKPWLKIRIIPRPPRKKKHEKSINSAEKKTLPFFKRLYSLIALGTE